MRLSSLAVSLAVVFGLCEPTWAGESMAGLFAFPTGKPDKSHCVKIDAALAAKLRSPRYQCEKTHIESGANATLCSSKIEGAGGYMVLRSLKACEEERRNEAAAE